MQEIILYCVAALYLVCYFIARNSIQRTTGGSLSVLNVLGVVLEPLGILVRHVRKLPTYSKDQHWQDVLNLRDSSPTPDKVKFAAEALLEKMRSFSFAYPYPQLAAVKRHIRAAESSAWTTVELAEEDALWREWHAKEQAYRLSLSPRQLAVVMLQERGYGHCDCRPATSAYHRGIRRGLSPYGWY